ncbi:UNVERIFIED_CONTAM: hypothetical protein Slati_0225000 [Sesamum latifolium]|uniref:RNase H type-1 domain-containing protein n=1 Tax=Sesamum latifolium TaxID=2727402 RepID=A0AAW2YC80_9LAMI
MLHIDGSSTSSAGGAGILLQGPRDVEVEAARLDFSTTNNEAEYEAVIIGLRMPLEAGGKQLDVYTDSQLVAMQIDGSYETQERSMTQYLKNIKDLIVKFDKCVGQQISKEENPRAELYLSLELWWQK